MAYIFLAIGIISEVIGTTMLKASQGFTKLLPAIGGVIGFGCALYFLALSFKTIPLNIAYATWAGVGTAGATLIGVLLYNEKLNIPGLAGILLIIVGILLLNLTAPAPSAEKMLEEVNQSVI
ncbi:multidrug efflux SMR transporter [Alkalihalobacillus sp. MEB130]|uniref:DMT family transporter n=1 Tax=Alkalihalobacillus sp. MEB130 TaxID=2976704 RepID=UPI0028E021B6|nr:multidrug efflux SMR transporter [Alkalihalobacillus sp. MEB130]MDT8861353.1 multidrug efflux SMR transporter [Alkalihalobacillus sp. MEB130]